MRYPVGANRQPRTEGTPGHRLGRLFIMLLTVVLLHGCAGVSHLAPAGDPAQTVIVYTRGGCPYCAMAKTYLTQHRVRFQEYDIYRSEKGSRDFKALGGIGVPIIVVGDKRMDGYDENRLAQLLKTEGLLSRQE